MLVLSKQKFINIVILIVAIVAVILSGYFYYQLHNLKSPQALTSKETMDLVSKVSKLYLVPADETPTVATVSDPEILKNQSFFIRSLKGDKVLIYAQAGKAILYRPSADKIVEVASISNGSTPKTEVNQVPTIPTPTTTATTPTKPTTKKN